MRTPRRTTRTAAQNAQQRIQEFALHVNGEPVFRVSGLGERGLRWKLTRLDTATGEAQLQADGWPTRTAHVDELVYAPLAKPQHSHSGRILMAAPNPSNSKSTRVEPIFRWLEHHGGADWPERLLQIAEGLGSSSSPGPLQKIEYVTEVRVPPSATRLAWMICNADRLAPRDGRQWQEYRRRVIDNPRKAEVLRRLGQGVTAGIPSELILEGESCADCLIECERALIWVEGKRNDWLEAGIKWDIVRDQLARDLEAAWILATGRGKDYCLLICHEYRLKHHEQLLVDGYRAGSWNGGWPHLDEGRRREFAHRIGTLKWATIVAQWPPLSNLPELQDLAE